MHKLEDDVLTAICKHDRICCDQVQPDTTDGQAGEHDAAIRVFLQSLYCGITFLRPHGSINPRVFVASSPHLVFYNGQELGPVEIVVVSAPSTTVGANETDMETAYH